MLPEISLSILDIVQNSIHAHATKISIHIHISESTDCFTLVIEDNGDGMSPDLLDKVINPFYTTRTTRDVGLGIPFLKAQTEITGGNFHIASSLSIGTIITCNYILSHIDRMPLGDLVSTIHSLVISYEYIHFILDYKVNMQSFLFDTTEIRNILGDISFQSYEVSTFIKQYLIEQIHIINQGTIY